MKEREQLKDAIAALDAQRSVVGEQVVAAALRPMRERLAALAGHALLFTDVIDSTMLVERLGDARAAKVWAEHDRRARELLARHRGREIDRTDGFFLLFEDVADAAHYALAYHHALADLALNARAGLHVGPVMLYENAPDDVARGAKRTEVEGFAKPVAARVMALARGRQTLLTGAAQTALGVTLPVGAEIRSHGFYRFKGVDEPVEVFELGVRDFAPFSPPADADKAYRVVRAGDLWRPVREVRHNLPAERDAFVGRTGELRALAARLDAGARLLTVLGAGGTGKTRFVRRYGWTWLGDWPGGVYFCDLSEARSLDGIFFAVGSTLDVPLSKEPTAQLGHAIASRGRCLVILDNFEQVVEHAPVTLGRWLDQAAGAAFVVTSRERLHLPGEEIFAIEPLSLDKEAIDLFAERARAQKPDFVLGDTNRAAVAEVVRLLDGLPLAIELAAARVRVLSPVQLVERMRDRFHLLTGVRGASARQATLKAAIDWSWDLLTPWEQAAFAQCAVFEGGFTLEAAEALLDLCDLPDARPAIDVVQALVDKSLLRMWVPSAQGRYDVEEPYFGMYVSVREYAWERLKASGPAAEEAAEERHGRYFARFGTEEALEALFRHGGVRRRRALALELDNLVSACRRAVGRGDGNVAVATYRAAWEVLELQGTFALGDALGAQVLALEGIEASLRAAALLTKGLASRRARRMEDAALWHEQALVLFRELRNRRLEGHALGHLGDVRREQGRMEQAREYSEKALAILREVGDQRFEGFVLGSLGFLHHAQGHLDEARAYFEQALVILRDVGDRRFECFVLANLGSLHFEQGREEEGRAHYDQAFAITREVGNRRFEGILLRGQGDRHRDQGRWAQARTHYEAALAMIREVGGDHRFEGMILGSLANLLLRQGRISEAKEALGAGETLLKKIGNSPELAELLCTRGHTEVAAGDLDRARAALAQAETVIAAIGAAPGSDLCRDVAKLRAALA